MQTLLLARRHFLKAAAAVGILFSGLLRPVTSFAAGSDPVRPEGFKGPFISHADPRYFRWFWAMTWYNKKPKRFPDVIAQPLDAEDIKILLIYAKQTGRRVALRSSGHNITLAPLRNGAVTIDMSRFNSIELDPQTKTAWAGPGVLSQELNEATFDKGLVFPGAHTGFVTLGGFLLGGGMGWNMPAYGMACGSILAAEVMLADGSIVMASPDENPDLYWAMRGVGPGFFAVVLRYRLKLHDAPAAIMNSFYFPVTDLRPALDEIMTLLPANAKRSEILGALGKFSPPGTPPSEQRWHLALNVISFGSTEAEAREVADIFNNSKLPDLCTLQSVHNRSLTYLDLFQALGATDAYSTSRTSETAFFTDRPELALPVVAELLENEAVDSRSFGFSVIDTNPTVPEPCSFTYWAPHYISWYLIGSTEEEIEANRKLMLKLNAAIKPYAKGYYINEIDLDVAPELVNQCFSAEKWQKLNQVRVMYDPEKRFYSYIKQEKDGVVVSDM